MLVLARLWDDLEQKEKRNSTCRAQRAEGNYTIHAPHPMGFQCSIEEMLAAGHIQCTGPGPAVKAHTPCSKELFLHQVKNSHVQHMHCSKLWLQQR